MTKQKGFKLFGNMKGKKGDLASLLYVVVLLFVIGVVFIMTNNLNHRMFVKIQENLERSPTLNESSAIPTIEEIRTKDDIVWDYAFLGIFLGSMFALGMTAYSTRISPVFYWIYAILSLVVLIVGTMLSNFWQAAAATPEMVETITRFPITNFLLGTYYPTVVVAIIVFMMVLLFGKTPDNAEGLA